MSEQQNAPLRDSGNVKPDVEYVGFVVGAKTERSKKPDGSVSYWLKLRLGSMIDPAVGWVDGNKIWIDHQLFLTPAAQAASQKRIADVFGVSIEQQDRAFFAEPNKLLYRKECRFTTENDTYNNRTRVRVKWLNHIDPPQRSEVSEVTDEDIDVILSRTVQSASEGAPWNDSPI